MQKQAPTLPRLLLMAGFALSCFGLILFLWVAFGGPTPFAAKGYEVKVDFVNAGQLASQADVRISGVPVGKVAKVELGPRNATRATLQIDPRYSPIPADSRAILRVKTLLGETYVELTPGNRANGAPLPDGAMLPASQVRQQVTIDRILQTFDQPTRRAWQVWQQSLAGALAGRGGDLNDAFGNLPEFTASADRTLTVLNSEGDALRQLVRDTGVVFNALSERDNQLRESIVNSNTVFSTTAQLNSQLAQIFEILPTFENQSVKTLNQLKTLAATGDPLMRNQLIPAARQISPTLESVGELAKPLNTVLTQLKPVVNSSADGVPALDKFLNGNGVQPGLSKVLGGPDSLDRFLNQLNPMLAYLSIYKRAIPSFFANTTAATQAGDSLATPTSLSGVHYLRAATTINALSLAAYGARPNSSRTTPYFAPDASLPADPAIPAPRLPRTYELKDYLIAHCSSSVQPKAPTTASVPDKPNPPYVPPGTSTPWDPDAAMVTAIRAMAFGGTLDTPPAPVCNSGTQQPKVAAPTTGFHYDPYNDYSGLFPQLAAQGAPH